jgi:adenylate cyclase
VLVVISRPDSSQIKDVFLCGADNCIARDECEELLSYKLRPLLINNVLNSELVGKLSILQEQAIHDFILQDIIKKYVPQELYKQADVYAHEQKILIPEQELELTIVFGDIKDFTRISQHLDPSEVISNLNNVFEIVTRHVYETNGDVDKFIGDAFFGVFQKAKDAVNACVKIQDEVAKLNSRRKKEKLDPIQFRFGIHTGPIIRGNVGGNERFDNTMIGDTVNTASRLESVCEPGEILISDLTREKAGLKIPKERHIKKQLRGREGEETLYYVYEYLKKK